jgi:hypothetical protein
MNMTILLIISYVILLKVRVGDAVYILNDTSLETRGITPEDYVKFGKDKSKLDIFRVETLWKTEE